MWFGTDVAARRGCRVGHGQSFGVPAPHRLLDPGEVQGAFELGGVTDGLLAGPGLVRVEHQAGRQAACGVGRHVRRQGQPVPLPLDIEAALELGRRLDVRGGREEADPALPRPGRARAPDRRVDHGVRCLIAAHSPESARGARPSVLMGWNVSRMTSHVKVMGALPRSELWRRLVVSRASGGTMTASQQVTPGAATPPAWVRRTAETARRRIRRRIRSDVPHPPTPTPHSCRPSQPPPRLCVQLTGAPNHLGIWESRSA
jgi:hypothetical protein